MPVASSISIEAGSNRVIGYLTSFVAADGDTLLVNGLAVEVTGQLSTSELVLKYPWPGPAVVESTNWSLVKTGAYWSSAVTVNSQVTRLIQMLEGGMPLKPDRAGPIAERVLYDEASEGFLFLQTDINPYLLYVKLSDAAGDWSAGQRLQADVAAETAETIASAEAAHASEVAAAASATAARTSETAAKGSEDRAAQHETNSAASAGQSAASASASADSAAASLASQQAAKASQDAAAASETASKASEASAASSASTATTQAATATSKAQESAASAAASLADREAAQTARTGAETARTGAETARTGAETARTGSEAARDISVGARDAAIAARDAAQTSETNSKTSETNSKASEQAAASSASTASMQAEIATTKAQESASNTAASLTDRQAAETARTGAETAQTDAQTARTGAETARSGAEAAQSASETARTESQSARDTARLWATQAEDVIVSGSEYSAFHWAQKAQEFAQGAAVNISFAPYGTIAATNVQTALQELADEKVSKTDPVNPTTTAATTEAFQHPVGITTYQGTPTDAVPHPSYGLYVNFRMNENRAWTFGGASDGELWFRTRHTTGFDQATGLNVGDTNLTDDWSVWRTIWHSTNFDPGTKVDKTTTVNGKPLSGSVMLDKVDVGLSAVDNTSDASKPVSTAQQAALDTKQTRGVAQSALFGTVRTQNAPTGASGDNTGTVYFGKNDVYHSFDGASHIINGGPLIANSDIRTKGRLRVGDGGGASWIEMWDQDEGTRYVHCNSGLIGFLNNAANWVFRTADNGDAYLGQAHINGAGGWTIGADGNIWMPWVGDWLSNQMVRHAHFSSNWGGNGYLILPNNQVIQWGQVQSGGAYYFPLGFNCYGFSAITNYVTAGRMIQGGPIDYSRFQLYGFNVSNGASGVNCFWLAFGWR